MYSNKQRANEMINYIKRGTVNILSELMSAVMLIGIVVYFVS
jgi:hypothetical protein